MAYNIDFDIAAVIINLVVLICLYTMKDMKKLDNKVFSILIICNFMCSLFDLQSAWGISYPFEVVTEHTVLYTYLYMLFHVLAGSAIYVYVTMVSGKFYVYKKLHYVIMLAPQTVAELLVITNPFHHLVFWFDSKGYHRGPGLAVLYISIGFYLIAFLVHLLKNHASIKKKRIIMLFSVIIMNIAAIIVQFLHPELLFELFVQAVVYIAVLLSIEDEGCLYNKDFDAYNKEAFVSDMRTWLYSGNRFSLIIIKILNLPSYQTLLGDGQIINLLKSVISWINKTSKNITIYLVNNTSIVIQIDSRHIDKTHELSRAIYERLKKEFICNDACVTFESQIYEIFLPDDIDNLEDVMTVLNQQCDSNERTKLYSGTDLLEVKEVIAIDKAIQRALKADEFDVYYQPVIDLRTKKVVSVEALVRLFDKKLGHLDPERFIPIAEKNGTIAKIGEMVFDKVCKFISENNLLVYGIHTVEVNLSAVQCMQKDLVENYIKCMKKYNVSASMITLEITEKAFINDYRILKNIITKLRAIGFNMVLDNYSASCINLNAMLEFDFKHIKTEKRLMENYTSDKAAEIFVDQIAYYLHEAGKEVTIEGVETKKQIEILLKKNFEYLQGFYFSVPLDAFGIMAYLRDYTWKDYEIKDDE